MRELFLAKSNELGLMPRNSCAARAAAKAGVPERLFKRHGCWKSESAKDGYVEDLREALLSVSESLKL